jgi:hypothetical protein
METMKNLNASPEVTPVSASRHAGTRRDRVVETTLTPVSGALLPLVLLGLVL